MKLRLIRDVLAPGFTLGTLHDDVDFFANTCEDTDRFLEDGGEKVYGQTAIPVGLYKVRLSWSPRFGRILPELLDVPGFVGIRIHGGNRADDTHGCILVGHERLPDGVRRSAGPLQYLIELIAACEKDKELVEIEISRAVTGAIA